MATTRTDSAVEQIRRLHETYTGRLEARAYESAVDLFIEQAQLDLGGNAVQGIEAIHHLFADGYRRRKADTQHSAYRANGHQRQDRLTVSEDQQHATATWHVDVRVCSPVRGDVHWESGLLEASYVKADGLWRIESLSYLAS